LRITRSRTILTGIVTLGLALRIALMLLCRSYEIPNERNHWNFGYETGRIASSLAAGRGFSSPMPEPSGPTGLNSPGYPLILAGIFRVFGTYTTESAVAAYLLNCLFFALTSLAIYRLGGRVFGGGSGLAAAALLAVYPASIWHATNTIWDTTLTGLAVVLLVLWFYELPPCPGAARLAGTGAFMGFAAFLNPAPVAFYPAAAFFVWKRLRAHGSKGYREVALLTACCVLVCLPWMVRNAVVLGSFTPRTCAGLNFRLGNSDGAWRLGTGAFDPSIYPSNSERENALFHQLGEVAYDRYCARIGMEFVARHPDRFASLTLVRIAAWWLGQSSEWRGNLKLAFQVSFWKRISFLLPLPLFILGYVAAWRNRAPVGLVVAVLLMFPLPYYFLIVSERYRFPVEPLMLLVGGYGLERLLARWSRPGEVAHVRPE
jgi:4-amino-4-deoxy-L-arabinose transferase-like glycosyltransferase